MIRKTLIAFAVVASFGLVSPSQAHHGTAINYDVQTQIVVDATVTKFRFAQPHLQIFFDVKNEDGTTTPWAGEYVPNIPTLIREGWTRKRMNDLLPVGTDLKITMSPSRSGKPVGLVLKMAKEGGEVVGMAFDKTDAPSEAAEAGDAQSKGADAKTKDEEEDCVCP